MGTKSIKDKVKCHEAGCGFEDHILVMHIKSKHSLEPVAYWAKHGGMDKAPLWSAYGLEKIRQHSPSVAAKKIPRPRKSMDSEKLFPDFAKRLGHKTLTGKIEVFAQPDPMAPELNESYLFPVWQTLDFLSIVEKPKRNRIYIQGPTGSGKSDFVRNLAAKVGAGLMQWNADSFQDRGALVGKWIVKDGELVWIDGILPHAMRNGYWLCIHEIDTIDSHTMNVLKPVLEDPGTLTILENGAEVVEAHPDFRVCATANTWGRGDATGMYVNTMIHSAADMRRWNARLLLDYLEAKDEEMILKNYFGSDLEKDEPANFVKVANAVRDAFKLGNIGVTFSVADLVNWAENHIVCGQGVHHAARLSFLNAYEPATRTAVLEYINATFGHESDVKTRNAAV